MFFDDSHIFSVMADIDGIRPSLDEEVKLTPCFRAHEFRCSRRCVVDATSVGQVLFLNVRQSVPDGTFIWWIRESGPSTINMAIFHGLVNFFALLRSFLSFEIFCEESFHVPVCTILDLIEE